MEPKNLLSEERLKYVRLKAVLPVKFRFINKSDHKPITAWEEATTQNISITGTYIEIKNPPENILQKLKDKSILIELRISLQPVPETSQKSGLEAVGEVVWSKHDGVGLSFYGISSNGKRLIGDYILERLR
ncbi:MAG: PilZ domain-containing protein [Candidatus Omnitrophica bacterium]|nr:PilZ domain-containing protein [Candidatus Omnitrophota bacterium]